MHYVGHIALGLFKRNVAQAVIDCRYALLEIRCVAAVCAAAGRIGRVERVMRLLLASVDRRGVVDG